MNLFDLYSRGAPVYVDGVQIAQKPRAVQMNLFDLHSRGATVYVDEVQIAQKPRELRDSIYTVVENSLREYFIHNGMDFRD